ncbi:MAG TPA: Gfo/Idh/MocA family oxidoreductase [Acidimicrobiia bacterium]
MGNRPIRVGIVGVGWGAFIQGPGFRAVPEFELAALCGRRPGPLADAAARLSIDDTSTDWASFVSRPDLDLISVATPVALHHPIAMAAIAAGKHVLCEKPLAVTEKEAAELVDAAGAAGVVAATGFELRWTPDRLAMWELIESGFLGSPYFVRTSQAKDLWHPTHRLQSPWMYDLDQGGGQLSAGLSHDIDFVLRCFGPAEAVCADVRTSVRERTTPDGEPLPVTADDSGGVLLRLASGALAILSYTVMGAHAGGAEFEAYGSEGSVVAHGSGSASQRGVAADDTLLYGRAADDGLRPLALSGREPRTRPDLPPNRFSSTAIRAFALMLEDWLPAFSGGPSRAPSLAEGLAVQRIVEAARTSSEEGRWVSLEEPRPRRNHAG